MSNIFKILFSKHLHNRSSLVGTLVLIGLTVDPVFSSEGRDVVISTPTVRLGQGGAPEVASFDDMKSQLVMARERITDLLPYLVQDQQLHVQIIKSFSGLLEACVIVGKRFPQVRDGAFEEVLSPRSGDTQRLYSNEECLKLIERFRERLGPLRSSLTALEGLADQQQTAPKPIPTNSSPSSQENHSQKDGENTAPNLTKTKLIKDLQDSIQEIETLFRSDTPASGVIAIARTNAGLSSPGRTIPRRGDAKRPDSPRVDSPPVGGSSPGGEAGSSPSGGLSSPLLVHATTPRSGDSGQQLGGFANLVRERAIQRRSSQSAVVEGSSAASTNDTATKDTAVILSPVAASEVEPKQPGIRKSSAPPIPSRSLKKANGTPADISNTTSAEPLSQPPLPNPLKSAPRVLYSTSLEPTETAGFNRDG